MAVVAVVERIVIGTGTVGTDDEQIVTTTDLTTRTTGTPAVEETETTSVTGTETETGTVTGQGFELTRLAEEIRDEIPTRDETKAVGERMMPAQGEMARARHATMTLHLALLAAAELEGAPAPQVERLIVGTLPLPILRTDPVAR